MIVCEGGAQQLEESEKDATRCAIPPVTVHLIGMGCVVHLHSNCIVIILVVTLYMSINLSGVVIRWLRKALSTFCCRTKHKLCVVTNYWSFVVACVSKTPLAPGA